MSIDWDSAELNMGIVIVDDDPAVCFGVECDFKYQLGLQRVCSFTDPREALEYFQNHAKDVDIVLLDLKMPDIDGMEMLARIQELDSAIQVLVVSAYADQNTIKETITSLGLPVERVITKPLEVSSLKEVLHEAFREAQALRSGVES